MKIHERLQRLLRVASEETCGEELELQACAESLARAIVRKRLESCDTSKIADIADALESGLDGFCVRYREHADKILVSVENLHKIPNHDMSVQKGPSL